MAQLGACNEFCGLCLCGNRISGDAASSLVALSAFATGAHQAHIFVQLKDDTKVHIFSSGKMGMETQFGGALYIEPSPAMVTGCKGETVNAITQSASSSASRTCPSSIHFALCRRHLPFLSQSECVERHYRVVIAAS